MTFIATYLIRNAALKQKNLIDVYRIGGDEFCILLDNVTLREAKKLAQAIQNGLAQDELNEISLSITIAINNIVPLLENSDLALKHIKRDRNQKIIIYNKKFDLQQHTHDNIQVLATVKKALREDRFVPYFQPIVNLQNGKI